MAKKTILTHEQQKFLRAASEDKTICKNFYLTGGTALAEFYLHHRFSEDLDFFSEQEFAPEAIFAFLKAVQKQIGIKKIAAEQSFNRRLFFLYLVNGQTLKTEFTYFPFPRIEKGVKAGKLSIDSLIDIAVNKIFTVYQKPRARDFIDLYFIIKKTGWTIASLVKKAKIKFDWHIDPIQLGSQLLQAVVVKDYPRMLKKIEHKTWRDFFAREAKKIGKDVLMG